MITRAMLLAVLSLCAVLCARPSAVLAQNPVQWSGSVKQSVDRAAEQSLPLLIWVKDGQDGIDDDDLEDAQEDCFREPAVVEYIHKHFVPLRVNRNSRVIEEAKRLNLPTGFGLYCAVLTHDGRVIDQMGPGEVAQPPVFIGRLRSAYGRFCDDLFNKEIRPILDDPAAPKVRARLAAQTVYRLDIKQADAGIIALLARPDLQPTEKSRLYDLLASLATEACIRTLLDRAQDKAAVVALGKASPGAIEQLTPELPTDEGEPSARQMAAYSAIAKICRTAHKDEAWWKAAGAEARQKELDRLKSRAATVVEYWREHENMGG